jgi:hypothetical protein
LKSKKQAMRWRLPADSGVVMAELPNEQQDHNIQTKILLMPMRLDGVNQESLRKSKKAKNEKCEKTEDMFERSVVAADKFHKTLNDNGMKVTSVDLDSNTINIQCG